MSNTSTSKPLKPKRGTTAQNNNYTGEAYEVTLDTDKKTLVVHDGLTAGGFPLAKSAELEVLAENIDDNVGTIREDTVAAAQDAARASAGESGTVTLEGVAAEVGLKANANLDNLSAAGRSRGAGLGMPSGRYLNLGVGASGAGYKINKNGWIAVRGVTTGAYGYIHLYYTSPDGCSIIAQQEVSNFQVQTYIPARKGSTVYVGYSGVTINLFRFIYAEGEEA